MIYNLLKTSKFKRNIKKCNIVDKDYISYIDVVYKLLNNIKLDIKYKDHQLKGDKKSFRECHIKPDLLLIYKIEKNTLKLVDIGSHSELFK